MPIGQCHSTVAIPFTAQVSNSPLTYRFMRSVGSSRRQPLATAKSTGILECWQHAVVHDILRQLATIDTETADPSLHM